MITERTAAELDKLKLRYGHIEGDYEATLIEGVWHYLCDSGIKDDSFSAADRLYVDKVAKQYYDLDDLDYYYSIVCETEHLDCNRLLADLEALADQTGIDIEDLARELAGR